MHEVLQIRTHTHYCLESSFFILIFDLQPPLLPQSTFTGCQLLCTHQQEHTHTHPHHTCTHMGTHPREASGTWLTDLYSLERPFMYTSSTTPLQYIYTYTERREMMHAPIQSGYSIRGAYLDVNECHSTTHCVCHSEAGIIRKSTRNYKCIIRMT